MGMSDSDGGFWKAARKRSTVCSRRRDSSPADKGRIADGALHAVAVDEHGIQHVGGELGGYPAQDAGLDALAIRSPT